MMDPEDIARMAKLGMIGITAPYWQIIDDYYWDLYYPYLGPDRAMNEQYPMKSLFDAGVKVALHSDFFVTEPDYGWAFYSAVTRTMPRKIMELWYGEDAEVMVRTTDPGVELDYYDMGVLGPAAERVSLEEAVRAATYNGVYAEFLENDLGSIEVGKSADLVVLDRNLFDIDIEDVAGLEVLMTLFEGEVVYDAIE
jgi:predicted amidohydrolase YtcJ